MMTLSLSCKTHSVLLECNKTPRQLEKRWPSEHTRFDFDCVKPIERAERTVMTYYLIGMAKATHKTDVLLSHLHAFFLCTELLS